MAGPTDLCAIWGERSFGTSRNGTGGADTQESFGGKGRSKHGGYYPEKVQFLFISSALSYFCCNNRAQEPS